RGVATAMSHPMRVERHVHDRGSIDGDVARPALLPEADLVAVRRSEERPLRRLERADEIISAEHRPGDIEVAADAHVAADASRAFDVEAGVLRIVAVRDRDGVV